MNTLIVQAIGLVSILLIFKYCETRAAMRGCHRRPMHPLVDKALRVVFFILLTGPFVYFVDSFLPFPVLSTLSFLYLFSYTDLCEQSGGRNPIARKWRLFNIFRNHLKLTLVKTVDLDPKKKYVFGVHPHGILPFGSMVALGHDSEENGFTKLFPGIDYRVLAATFCFYVPLYRDLLLFGGVVDAARYSAHNMLSKGYSLALVPGGATEALYASPAKDVVYVKNRRGFVRLALEHGASLVPVFGFNENNTYEQLAMDNKFIHMFKSKFQKIFGISLPLITNIIPRRSKVTCVVGSPLDCPKIENPTNEQVQEYLDKYIDLLKILYHENKEKYNDPPTKPELEVL